MSLPLFEGLRRSNHIDFSPLTFRGQNSNFRQKKPGRIGRSGREGSMTREHFKNWKNCFYTTMTYYLLKSLPSETNYYVIE